MQKNELKEVEKKVKKTKKKPRHEVTQKSKGEVSALVSFGFNQDQIAAHLRISVDTLYRRYKEEIETSSIKANAQVAGCLFRKATVDKDLTAMIFWLKTRARWREKDREEDKVQDSLVQKLIDKL